jgi:hypothetical protein
MHKTKLDDLKFFNLLDELRPRKPFERSNLGYYDYYRTHIIRNGKKIYGTMYKLDTHGKPLTDAEKTVILSYPNTLLYYAQMRYAPEIKSNCVLVLDRCIRKAS